MECSCPVETPFRASAASTYPLPPRGGASQDPVRPLPPPLAGRGFCLCRRGNYSAEEPRDQRTVRHKMNACAQSTSVLAITIEVFGSPLIPGWPGRLASQTITPNSARKIEGVNQIISRFGANRVACPEMLKCAGNLAKRRRRYSA